ncbi:hypothetical protein AM10699_47390 [Acaryochloris marina MBIC10699]|nr:hypothetical protein AM10699_47390 [Acaryochloris marina MBIC10699]
MKPDRKSAGFFDASVWEFAKKTGPVAIKRLINAAVNNTSVTCVLIGSQTYARPWVRYELLKSFRQGNKLLAVHINSIKGRDQKTKSKGYNPLSYVGVSYSDSGLTATLHEKVNGKWQPYTEIDGSASYHTGGVPEEYRGNGYNLGRWYSIYAWVSDDGYRSFAGWVA